MKLKAAFKGELSKFLEEEIDLAEKAATRAMKETVKEAVENNRRRIRSFGMPSKMEKTIRGEVYPKRGKKSMEPAGFIYTKASKIWENLQYAQTIKSSKGYFMAIPTENAPKTIYRQRTTPALYEKRYGPLRYVPRKGGADLLVADDKSASIDKKTGRIRSFRKAGKGNLKKNRKVVTVPIFYLVPAVHMPKVLDFFEDAERAHKRLPARILKYWKDRHVTS